MTYRTFLFLLVPTLAGCNSTTISLSDFDTSCVHDQDCVVVTVGEICGCACGNAAINVKDLAAWQAEADAKGAHCDTKSKCECPVSGTATCVAGRCAFKGL
jgi:hypothetical protein